MEKVKEFITTMKETVTITKKDCILITAVCVLGGIVIGMLISPRKHQTIGCNNGNCYGDDGYGDTWEYDTDC